jgi:DNA polymerase alpha-associated DNA helicase A
LCRRSFCNLEEVETTVKLVAYLLDLGMPLQEIGVIGFYKAQVEKIADSLTFDKKRPVVAVSTVDSFQGDQKDVIIISIARTQSSLFLESSERISVAITRAKRHLFLVSNLKAFFQIEI